MNNNAPKATILITGGAGFIGSHLSDHLLTLGYRVKVIDNLSNGNLENLKEAQSNPNFSFVKGDILDKEMCMEVAKNCNYIFHLACLGVRHSIHSPFENHRVNAEGTLNILEAARQNKIDHFFYISTSEIYGRTTSFPITEEAATAPLTVYGASKLVGEHYTNAYNECYQLPTTVLRIFNNYGPRAHYEGDSGEVIPRSIVRILYNEKPIIFGDGQITRDFFFVKDTARALADLIGNKNINYKTFNIGTGVEISMKELLTTILKMMDRVELGLEYLPDRPADVPRLWVKADKFYAATNFKANYSFEDGLRETINYYIDLSNKQNLIEAVKVQNWEK
ncbi:MAG: SDR family NAD(P)-dependent oxidoreductase [Bacteroidetes bacterium]|nr:SDR family NAD(P)-dependent oxidoreductase [Bacteroidota bacterium]